MRFDHYFWDYDGTLFDSYPRIIKGFARGAGALEAARQRLLRERPRSDGFVTAVTADITTPRGREAVFAAHRDYDIVVTNAGGPPPGDFREWEREDWIRAVEANMLAPIFLIKATVDGMMARRFGRIVNVTSAAVKAPISNLGLSNGARAGLTGFVAGLSRQTVRHNVTINNLLPGPFETDRLRTTMEGMAKAAGRSVDEEMDARRAINPAGRFGDPAEFGAMCAFLCSAQAGFMTGQNVLLDGGSYPGTL